MPNDRDNTPAGPPPAIAATTSPAPPSIGTAEWLSWQRRQRADALAAAGRAARASQAREPSRAVLAAVAAERAAAPPDNPPAPRSHPVAAGIPAPSRAAARLAVSHPRLWERDLPRALRRRMRDQFSAEGFLSASRARARARSVGGNAPLAPSIVRVAELLVWAQRKGAGIARITFGALARLGGMCIDTARRAVRWLESGGLLTTANTMGRTPGGAIRRTANAYLLNGPAAEAAPAEEPRPTIGAHWAEWSAALGLAARSYGWNRFPAREREAPA